MVEYFKIYSGGKSYGTLEIQYDRYRGDPDVVWEWQAGPEGSDGGPAGWVKNGGNVYLILESSNSGMYSSMGCIKWNKGSLPPKRPWFVNDFTPTSNT